MEGINPDNAKLSRIASTIRNVHSNPSATVNVDLPAQTLGSTLSAHSELVENAKETEPDNRPDRIARAKALINDPNWLDDLNLDKLANKILQEEI
jgi:hypothetical protein